MGENKETKTVDILVVGAGVAGLSAATAAAWSGRSVTIIEKSEHVGGTARFANGSIWIPNNDLAVEAGITHDEQNQIQFILSECWDSFDANEAFFGVDEHVYKRTERFVSEGAKVIRDLSHERVQSFTQLSSVLKMVFFSKNDSIEAARKGLESKESNVNGDLERAACAAWDYHWDNPYNIVPYGKHIWAAADLRATSKFFGIGLKNHAWHILHNVGSIRSWRSLFDQVPKLFAKFWGFGHGLVLVERFRRHLKRKRIPILTKHTLHAVHMQDNNAISVEVQTPDGEISKWQIMGGLILANGCFSHQLKDVKSSSMPIRSSCVQPDNDGDSIRILGEAGVQIDDCPRPLLAQSVLQLAEEGKGVSHEPVFFLYGDSFFVVDRFGRRVMNEKLNYHDRALHHVGTPDNEILFLIGDRRFKERNWGFGISLPFDQRHLIRANSPNELKIAIDRALSECGIEFGLADEFATNLGRTIESFNEYARSGVDVEFGRGDNVYDVLGFPKADRDNTFPSRTMCPLAGDDLFACLYSLSTFTTHGGLICDGDSRVLKSNGAPLDNVYAVGTCAASFLRGKYPAHGMSIGTGIVFGYLAGLHATGNSERLRSS